MTEAVHISKLLPATMRCVRERMGRARRRWRRLRQQALERDQGICQRCGAPAVIAVHRAYDDEAVEVLDDLISLCEDCYEKHFI